MIVLHKKDCEKYIGMDARLDAAFQMIADGTADKAPFGKTEDSENLYHNTQSYETKSFENTKYEAHEYWIDVQYIRAGKERIDVLVSAEGTEEIQHNVEGDCIFFKAGEAAKANQVYLEAGMLAVFYPEDLHRPCICVEEPETVEKVVFKAHV